MPKEATGRQPGHQLAPALVVEGTAGTVSRVRPARMAVAVPIHTPDGCLVDVWVMPGGMHAVCLRGSSDEHAFLLCYVDQDVLTTTLLLGVDPSLAVDVWLFQRLRVRDDTEARIVMRHVIRAAADGVLPFEPIRPADRELWRVAVDSLTAVQTRRATV